MLKSICKIITFSYFLQFMEAIDTTSNHSIKQNIHLRHISTKIKLDW